jgi:hypothetical protein
MSDTMQYVSRAHVPSDKQMLTSYEWGYRVVEPPQNVYLPSEEVHAPRALSIVPPPDISAGMLETQLRGFTLKQPGLSITTGDFTMTFQDFEDQEMVAFITDWLYTMSNPNDQTSAPREEMKGRIDILRLNVKREVVKTWKCEGVFPVSMDNGESMTGTKDPIGPLTVNFTAEFYKILPEHSSVTGKPWFADPPA